MDYTRGTLLPYVPSRIARMWVREGAFPLTRHRPGTQGVSSHLMDDLLEIQGLGVCKSGFAKAVITDPQKIRDLFYATADRSIKDALLNYEHAPLDLLVEDAELHRESPSLSHLPLFTKLTHVEASQMKPWIQEFIRGSAALTDNLWRNTMKRGDSQGVHTALKSVDGTHSLVAALAHLPSYGAVKQAEVNARTQIFGTIIEKVERFRRCDVKDCGTCAREHNLEPAWLREEPGRCEYFTPRVLGTLRAFVDHLFGTKGGQQHEDFINEAQGPLEKELREMVPYRVPEPEGTSPTQDSNGELARAAKGLWDASAERLRKLAEATPLTVIDYKLSVCEELSTGIPAVQHSSEIDDSFCDVLAHLVGEMSNLDLHEGGADIASPWTSQVGAKVVDRLLSGAHGTVNWQNLALNDPRLAQVATSIIDNARYDASQVADFKRQVWSASKVPPPSLMASRIDFVLDGDEFYVDPDEWLPYLRGGRPRREDLFEMPGTLLRMFELLSVEQAGFLVTDISWRSQCTPEEVWSLHRNGKLPVGQFILERNTLAISRILTEEFGEDAEDKWTVFADLMNEGWSGSSAELVATVKSACG